MRILTWFQFHLTLVTLLIAIFVTVILRDRALSRLGPDDRAEQQVDRLQALILALAGTAILLAAAAALVRRGFAVAFALVILAEVAVLADVALPARAGTLAGIVAVLLVILGGWILADLFRSEVRMFLMRSPRRH